MEAFARLLVLILIFVLALKVLNIYSNSDQSQAVVTQTP